MTTFADLNRENRELAQKLEEVTVELATMREQHTEALALVEKKQGEICLLEREKKHTEIISSAWEDRANELEKELRQKFMLARAAAGDNIKSAMVFTASALRYCAGENVLEELTKQEAQRVMEPVPSSTKKTQRDRRLG